MHLHLIHFFLMFQKLVTFQKYLRNVTKMVCYLRVLTRLIHDSDIYKYEGLPNCKLGKAFRKNWIMWEEMLCLSHNLLQQKLPQFNTIVLLTVYAKLRNVFITKLTFCLWSYMIVNFYDLNRYQSIWSLQHDIFDFFWVIILNLFLLSAFYYEFQNLKFIKNLYFLKHHKKPD